jgi:hypothetical protein
MICAVFMSLAAQAAPAEPLQRWEHELVIHDDYEDFWADGALRGAGATVRAEGLALEPAHADGALPGGTAWMESTVIACPGGFHQLAPSWNVVCPAGFGFAIELRVARDEGEWSPWLYFGDWGEDPPRMSDPHVTEVPDAKVAIDVLESSELFHRAQYRIGAASQPRAPGAVVVRRVALCFSRRVESGAPRAFEVPSAARQRLAVPFRSQKDETAEIAGRICSPTSVAMVMSYRGVDVPTAEVAARVFDGAHDIYGNWTRAVQGAYSFGVPGYLARFSDWNEVARHIAAGQPLVISIAAKPGELGGAPYPQTDGHLLVLCGFDERGDVLVNDPAAATRELGQLTYRRDQLERVWLARGGTSYVLLPKER